MTTVSDIIERLGGVKPLARALDIPPTTIYSWRDKNYIPTWRHPTILELLPVDGSAPITPADFPEKQAA